MDRRALRRWISRIWITLGLTATVVFVAWSLVAYRATGEARRAIGSDSVVAIAHGDAVWSFLPRRAANPGAAGLVFFPGALVDPVAYAPLLRAAAAAGYPAYLVELPRRGALGGADDPVIERRLEQVVAAPNAPKRWVIAGHSRGAVVASRIAAEGRGALAGLVLIGTSHPRDVDLSATRMQVTKIAGTRDGLASRAQVEANRPKLPASTRWVWIDGGNHSQFGWYGFQPGDRRATIAAPIQRARMTEAVIAALASSSSDR